MNEQNKKVPTLRFNGFTDDWEQRKFNQLIIVDKRKNKDRLAYEPYSISNTHGFIPQDRQFGEGNTYSKTDKKTNYIVKPHSFAYNPARINVGSIAYQNLNMPVLVSSLYEIFRTKEDINDYFLWCWFHTKLFSDQVKKYQEGGVRQYYFIDKLKFSSIKKPTIDEQKMIANLFKLLSKLITLQQRKLALLKDLKKGLLQKMFADKDSKRPILRFNGFTDDWEHHKLDEIASLEDNKRKPVKASDRVPGNVPYYGANGIQDHVKGYTHTGEHVLVAEDGANSISNYPVYFICSPSWVNNHAHVLTGKELMTSNKFLTYDLMTVHYGKYLVGSGRYKLNAETLKVIPIRIPSLTEQKYIGGVLSKVDNIINLQQQKLKKISKVKESFLQQMFI